jgi:hypothetical protein
MVPPSLNTGNLALFLLLLANLACQPDARGARTDSELIMELVLNHTDFYRYAPWDTQVVRVKSVPELGTDLKILRDHREVEFFISDEIIKYGDPLAFEVVRYSLIEDSAALVIEYAGNSLHVDIELSKETGHWVITKFIFDQW